MSKRGYLPNTQQRRCQARSNRSRQREDMCHDLHEVRLELRMPIQHSAHATRLHEQTGNMQILVGSF